MVDRPAAEGQRLGYQPGLDGLRGLAILLVISWHYFNLFGGIEGVDVFFVLSGFLITALLLEERAATGSVSLRGFYARRARRLLPALAVLLLIYAVVEALRGVNTAATITEYGLYVANIYIAIFAPHATYGLTHLWSLAMEEQFYVIWPAALLLLLRLRRPLSPLLILIGVLVVYRLGLQMDGATASRLYFAPDTHADGLLIGSGFAISRHSAGVRPRRTRLCAAVLPLSFAAVSIVNIYELQLPLYEVAVGGLVLAAVTPGTWVGRVFSWRPLVWIGTISYSLYLWHYPVLYWLGSDHRFVAVPLSFACAYASYRWVEQPFRRRRKPQTAALPALPETA